MLLLGIYLCVSLLLILSLGLWLNRLPGFRQQRDFRLLSVFLNGWTALLLSCGITSLWLPMGPVVGYLLAGLVIAGFFVNREGWKKLFERLRVESNSFNIPLWGIGIILTILVLEKGSLPPLLHDSQTYHLQMIKWATYYPAVPGLANLHFRLGFGTLWMLVQSISSLAFSGSPVFNANLLLSLAGIWTFLAALPHLLLGRAIAARVFTLVFPIFLIFQLKWLSSPDYDSPICWLAWLAIYLILSRKRTPLAAVVILMILPAIKLSALPWAIIGLVLLFTRKKSWGIKGTITGLSITITLAVLLLCRNYIQTGYPLFPYLYFGANGPDWQYPHDPMVYEHIRAYAIQPAAGFEQVNNWSLSRQYQAWWLFLPAYFKALILMALAGITWLWSYAGLLRNRKEPYFLAAVFSIGLALWFASAPDPRFGMAFLLGTCAAAFACLIRAFGSPWATITGYMGILFLPVMIYAGLWLSWKRTGPFPLSERWLRPVEPLAATVVQKTFPDGSILLLEGPDMGACSDAPLPCGINQWPLEKRGKDLKSGFRITR